MDTPGIWSNRAARVAILILAIGLVPMALGAAFFERQANRNSRLELDGELADTADAEVIALKNYFERARAIMLVTARNPAFADFYTTAGPRLAKIRAQGSAIKRAEAALVYLEHLYPTSIGEACFIDRTGPENARFVKGEKAGLKNLSPDESGNPFFRPTFALPVGQVYQARPYVSPDTGEWVISNSTLVPMPDGAKVAFVHFEVTVESFRRAAKATGNRFGIQVVDGSTGNIIIDSRTPQRKGAPLGVPGDTRFAGLMGERPGEEVVELRDKRAVVRRLPAGPGNANDWYVIASAKPVGGSLLGNNLPEIGVICLTLLLIGLALGRRWARINAEFAAQRLKAEQERRNSAERYRTLYEETENARSALANQNERLRTLDRMKDDFVASVSHELRTPLTSIRGYLELVLDGEAGVLSPTQEQFLAVVQRNADRLLRVVGDLLFVAQVDAGTMALESERLLLDELAEEAIEAARPAAIDKEIELLLDIEGLGELVGDRARLAQVLDNLVSNAVKFTPAGGRVSVRVYRDYDRAVVEVADTGMGISAEDQGRLFERFFRTEAAGEQAIPGTGLGLAIVKAIVEAHGGEIWVSSEAGVGATFRVAVPLERTEVAA